MTFLTFSLIPLLAFLAFRRAQRIEQDRLRVAARLGTGFSLAMSSSFLVLSLPSGSIDVSDLWHFAAFGLMPFIPLLGLLIGREIKSPRLRRTLTVLSSISIIPAGIFLLLMSLMQVGCVRQESPIYSPNGKYLALVRSVMQGALGDDYSRISIRRSWIPIATEVYAGASSSFAGGKLTGSPEVRWLDDTHLLISYSVAPEICRSQIDGIHISCEHKTSIH